MYLPLVIIGFGWYLSGNNAMHYVKLESMEDTGMKALHKLPLLCAQYGGYGVIICSSIAVGSSGWTFWILLAIVMANHIWIPYDRGGSPFDGDIYILGMMAYAWPMKGRERVKKVIRSYLPVLIVAACLFGVPHAEGRCDLHPLNTWWERLRFRFVESALLILLFSDAISPKDPYGLMGYLNMWALFAYCSHVAWARLFPIPFGAVFTYLNVVPFLVFGMRANHRQRQLRKGNGELLSEEYSSDEYQDTDGQHGGAHRR